MQIVLIAVFAVSNVSAADNSDSTLKTIPTELAQAILNHQILAPYWHAELDGRSPLVVSDHLLETDVALSMFGKPVDLVTDHPLIDGAYFRFDFFGVASGVAMIQVSYKVEGLYGHFKYELSGEKLWKVKEASIRERKIKEN